MASIIKANELQDFGGNSIITSDGAGTITLSSGMQTAVQSAGADNTPAFHCTMSGSQTIANATTTILQYDTEVYDTDSAFNTSNYTFTAPSAGKYFFKIATMGIFCDSTTEICIIGVYVNGTQYQKTTHNRGTVQTDTSFFHESIVPLSASDAVTAKIYHNQGSSRGNDAAVASTFFQGFKLIGV